MSRHDSRARAERVVLLRAVLRKPWREIMRSDNFGARRRNVATADAGAARQGGNPVRQKTARSPDLALVTFVGRFVLFAATCALAPCGR